MTGATGAGTIEGETDRAGRCLGPEPRQRQQPRPLPATVCYSKHRESTCQDRCSRTPAVVNLQLLPSQAAANVTAPGRRPLLSPRNLTLAPAAERLLPPLTTVATTIVVVVCTPARAAFGSGHGRVILPGRLPRALDDDPHASKRSARETHCQISADAGC